MVASMLLIFLSTATDVDGNITITNEQETVKIEVDKKWLHADGSKSWPDGGLTLCLKPLETRIIDL